MAISTRSSISRAALSVKVKARISEDLAFSEETSHLMRSVITVVLPVPAPAIISRGPSPCSTACFCSLFNFFSSELTIAKIYFSLISNCLISSFVPSPNAWVEDSFCPSKVKPERTLDI